MGTPTLPEAATYWMPGDDDIDEDDFDGEADLLGIGEFRDTWRIVDATVDDAAAYLNIERRMSRGDRGAGGRRRSL